MRKLSAIALAGLLVVMFAGSALAGQSGYKFALAVDHPTGTATLAENEVVYSAQNLQGGLGGTVVYAVHHQCFAGGTLVSDSTKGMAFAGNGNAKVGTAYFYTFGDTCTGVVIVMSAAATNTLAAAPAVLSNTVTYATSPLP